MYIVLKCDNAYIVLLVPYLYYGPVSVGRDWPITEALPVTQYTVS